MSFQNYVIEKGKHYSIRVYDFIRLPFKISLFTKNLMVFKFMFAGGCDQDVDQINKLYGFTLGWLVHRNSIRVGWKWHADEKKIGIYAYWYVDGTRKWLHICSVDMYSYYEARIIRHNDGEVDVRIFDATSWFIGGTTVEFKSIENKKVVKWRLFPYFGGKSPAKELVSIYIDEKI